MIESLKSPSRKGPNSFLPALYIVISPDLRSINPHANTAEVTITPIICASFDANLLNLRITIKEFLTVIDPVLHLI